MVSTTVAVDHRELCAAAEAVVEALTSFDERLDRVDRVDHEQHRVFLGRGERLAGHLRAALLLANSELFASAFVVIRTALEHQVQDRLLMAGSRWAAVSSPVDDEAWERIRAEFEAQETRWSRSLAAPPERDRRGRVTYVFRGVAERNDDPATTNDFLHPLYFEMDKYSPTTGRPADQANFDDGLTPLEHRKAFARDNRDRWHNWLTWSALRKGLEINDMCTGRDLVAVDVHYAFLSGFTHAMNASYDAAHDRYGTILSHGTAHFADELVRLYVAALGAAELRLLNDMEGREPPVRIDGRDQVGALIASAEAAAAPLWFLGGGPHEYDRVTERNRRYFSAARARDRAEDGAPAEEPEGADPTAELRDEELRYYSDPLERLRQMHRSFREFTTGIGYMSPWPNPTGNYW